MNQSTPVLSTQRFPSQAKDFISGGLFAISYVAMWWDTAFSIPALVGSNWLHAAFLLIATAWVTISNSRILPFQNILWGALVIGGIGGLANAIGALTAIPFGSYIYTPAAGSRIFDVLPWAIPFLWVLFIYASRSVAQLALRPWRATRFYGFWLMGFTATFSLILDLGLDPFASRVKSYWLWPTTKSAFQMNGTPLTNFAGWMLTSFLAMALVMPMLINKKPGLTPVEYRSSLVWFLLNGLFVTSAVVHGFWWTAGSVTVATTVVAGFTVRSACWQPAAGA